MKISYVFVALLITAMAFTGGVMFNETGKQTVQADRVVSQDQKSGYDPNDPIYKFLAPAPEQWRQRYGDNERTRLLYAISELRVVVAGQQRALQALQSEPNVTDPRYPRWPGSSND